MALADALTLGGTADYNAKARWKEQVNKLKLLGADIDGNLEYLDEPRYWDHSYLHLLNCQAISVGLDPIFDFVVTPSEDNDEVFVSKYFEQQEQRNSTVGQDNKTKLCNCRHCQAYVPYVQSEPQLPEEEHGNNAGEREQQQQQQQNEFDTESIIQHAVNSIAAAPTLAPVDPPFFRVHYGYRPPNSCFNWPPYYCGKKQEYYNRKYHCGGRRGRPPNCEINCPGQP